MLVQVIVDRPLGSYHPKYKNLCYPINYGYVPNIIAGDNEFQDAYILGIEEPILEFEGQIIAIIHRLDDNEDKWVVSNKAYSVEEIRKATHFQEQYFKIEIELIKPLD